MRKMKRGLATALAVTMVMGCSLTAFAADNSGGATGTGTSEGHLEKKVTNVVLPTDADTTTFKYTIDPERLIQETEGGKYAEGTVFPEKDTDTGVYFQTATNTYANTSNTLQVVNKSSCDVTLTVKVKATASAGGKDIDLATSETLSTTDPELYLGLKVGSTNTVISTTEATVTKTIAGAPTNFETAVKDGAYVYQEKANPGNWKAMNINMTGKVNEKAIAADTTAPEVSVTWSWADAAEGATADTDAVDFVTDAAPTAPATATYSKANGAEIALNLGTGNLKATGVESIKAKNAEGDELYDASSATYAAGKITISSEQWPRAEVGATRWVVVTFNDTAKTQKTIVVTVAE